LKKLKSIGAGKKMTGVFAYLSEIPQLLAAKCTAKDVEEFSATANLDLCLKAKAAYHIAQVQQAISEFKVD